MDEIITEPKTRKKEITGDQLIEEVARGFVGKSISKGKWHEVAIQVMEQVNAKEAEFRNKLEKAIESVTSSKVYKDSNGAAELFHNISATEPPFDKADINWSQNLTGSSSLDMGLNRRGQNLKDSKLWYGSQKVEELDKLDPNLRKEMAATLLAVSIVLKESGNIQSISGSESLFVNSWLDGKPDPKYKKSVTEADKLGKGLVELGIAEKIIRETAKKMLFKTFGLPENTALSKLQQEHLDLQMIDFHAPPEAKKTIFSLDIVKTFTPGEPPTLIEKIIQTFIKKNPSTN